MSCLLKVLVTGSRERSHQHYELAEVHLGVSIGVEVLEQLADSVLVLSTLGETEGQPGSVMRVPEWGLGLGQAPLQGGGREHSVCAASADTWARCQSQPCAADPHLERPGL